MKRWEKSLSSYQRMLYTFTPAGVQIEGKITALIDLDDMSLASVWAPADCRLAYR